MSESPGDREYYRQEARRRRQQLTEEDKDNLDKCPNCHVQMKYLQGVDPGLWQCRECKEVWDYWDLEKRLLEVHTIRIPVKY